MIDKLWRSFSYFPFGSIIRIAAVGSMILSHQIAIAQLDFMKKFQNFIDSKLMTDKEASRKDGFNLDAKLIEVQPAAPNVIDSSAATKMESQELKSAGQGAGILKDSAGSTVPAEDPSVVNKKYPPN